MIVQFEEKYVHRFVGGNNREAIFARVLQSRIDDGYWYDPDETEKAIQFMAAGNAERWMQSRRRYEYEGYDDITVEEA